MRNIEFVKTLLASGDIREARIVVQTGDELGEQAGADLVRLPFGISDPAAPVTDGHPVDVVLTQITPLMYGGAVSHGDPVTSDAQGRGVRAEPGSGQAVYCVGYAVRGGGEGTVGSVRIAPFIFTGPV